MKSDQSLGRVLKQGATKTNKSTARDNKTTSTNDPPHSHAHADKTGVTIREVAKGTSKKIATETNTSMIGRRKKIRYSVAPKSNTSRFLQALPVLSSMMQSHLIGAENRPSSRAVRNQSRVVGTPLNLDRVLTSATSLENPI